MLWESMEVLQLFQFQLSSKPGHQLTQIVAQRNTVWLSGSTKRLLKVLIMNIVRLATLAVSSSCTQLHGYKYRLRLSGFGQGCGFGK